MLVKQYKLETVRSGMGTKLNYHGFFNQHSGYKGEFKTAIKSK